MRKNSTLKFRRNTDELRVLAALVNCLPRSQSRAVTLLICEAITELVTPKAKHRQARSRNQIEQCRKKRRGTLKQKMKRVSNAVLYFVKIVTSVFTTFVIERLIPLEIIPFVWIVLEKVIAKIVSGVVF